MEVFYGVFTAEWEQRRAVLLHELSGRPRLKTEEEERRRRSVVNAHVRARGSQSLRQHPGGVSTERGLRIGISPSERPMAMRFSSLAAGAQPAVVKVASFGGGGRLKAMLNYISRHGALGVENEQGQALNGSSQLATIAGDWGSVLMRRSASRDIGTFDMRIETDELPGKEEWVRRLLKQALGERSFAFGIVEEAEGKVSIRGVTVLRSRTGERLTGDDKATEIIQRRLSEAQQANAVTIRFTSYGNGTDYGSRHLRALVRRCPGKVWTEDGRLIGGLANAGELVQREWRGQLHSRKSRDVMHLVLSARAGTDTRAFEKAGRAFLAAQFAGHRYAFSLHEPGSDPKVESSGGRRPHVHLHAIVSLRSDSGDRITTTISVFRQWRTSMADMARTYGIDMEMTDRRDRASAPAYSRKGVRPVLTAGRTLHVGTSEAANLRYNDKRRDRIVSAETSVQHRFAALRAWQHVEPTVAGAGKEWVQEQIGRLMSSDSNNRRSGTERSEADLRHARQDISHPETVEAQQARPFDQAHRRSIADAAREYLELRRELDGLLERRRKTADQRDTRSADEENLDVHLSSPTRSSSKQQASEVAKAEQAHAREHRGASQNQHRRLLLNRYVDREGEKAGSGQKHEVPDPRAASRQEPSHDDRER